MYTSGVFIYDAHCSPLGAPASKGILRCRERLFVELIFNACDCKIIFMSRLIVGTYM